MVAYGEFRCPYDNDPLDHRLVFFGMRHIIEETVSRRWTEEDVEKASLFFATHMAGYAPFPFPRELFLKVQSISRILQLIVQASAHLPRHVNG